MPIKRGVSLYSYQQAQFFKQMSWKDQIREVHDHLKTDGIEIIDEAVIRDYPFPSDQFIFDWNNTMARYGMKAVTMDIYLDVHQFRDHVMTHAEAAERLKNDIQIAARMGFENVRCLCMVPIEAIEMALPTAEKYNVRIGKEIHAPLPIKRIKDKKWNDPFILDPKMAEELMDFVDRTGTKHVGLVPDMGIFQHSPPQVAIDYFKRNAKAPEVVDFIVENRALDNEEILAKINEQYPGHGINPMAMHQLALSESSAQPKDLLEIIPYIVSIHGKFYQMTEIPGKTGQYEDKSIDYESAFKYLKQGGFDGYINSEYEGQRHQQDAGFDNLPNEIEEVRRHHEMMARLAADD